MADVFADVQAEPSRQIKAFQGEPWTLRFEYPGPVMHSLATVKILDSVSQMAFFAHDLNELWQKTDEQIIEENRERAYAFMLDRSFRMDHGMPIPTWSKQALEWMTYFGLFAVSLVALTYHVNQSGNKADESLLKCMSAMAASVCMIASGGVCCGFSLWGDPYLLRNMVFGPVDHQRLNLWARQILILDATAKADPFAREMRHTADDGERRPRLTASDDL